MDFYTGSCGRQAVAAIQEVVENGGDGWKSSALPPDHPVLGVADEQG
ncbi:MAG: hypothetical protein R2849_18975 [Thermomicrobiales bacterium]